VSHMSRPARARRPSLPEPGRPPIRGFRAPRGEVLTRRPQSPPRRRRRRSLHGECGQIAILLVGGLVAVAVGGLILGAVARGLGVRDAAQRAADLAALGGARAMRESYERLFEPPVFDGRANPRHLEKDAYLALGRAAAVRVAAANGAPGARVSFPDEGTLAPVRVRVAVERRVEIAGRGVTMRARAEAELAPPPGVGPAAFATGGGYDGPLEYRQGKPTRCFSQPASSGSRRRIGRRFSL
jgi:hypothetical protein